MTTRIPCTPYHKNFNLTLPASNYNFNAALTEGDALLFTVPGLATQKFRAKFVRATDAEIWVNYATTAVDPTANTATYTPYQELVPLEECRQVIGGSTMSFLAPAASPRISVSLTLIEDS